MAAKASQRVWFITGTSQGLGFALLKYVLARGESAVATLRNPAALDALAKEYPASQLLVVPLDVTSSAQIDAAFAAAKETFGRIDVIVNNAGYGLEGEIEAIEEADARKQIEVLFWGPVKIMKEAIKFLRDVNPPGQGGRVLNISSIGGYSANPTLSYYSAGKFALEGFTEAFTKEMLPEWNIKGIIIQLGGFRTEWAGSSMIRVPVPPVYAAPGTPSSIHRQMASQPYIGDPERAAVALVRITELEDPPLRVQLGTESLMIIRNKAKKTISDGEKYEEISHSTNLEGVDKDMVMSWFKDADK